jgi:hypothetical protein
MTTPPTPARLFVLLARTAPVGVILRRGPTQWVQLIKWNTDTDTFEPGQWFKGRIYEDKCDLSPDGKLLVYFAHKGGNSFKNPGYGDSWTAISKPPYFTALALWPVWGTWYGGGIFQSERVVWLNHKYVHEPHPQHQPDGIKVIQDESWYFDVDVKRESMSQAGWETIQTGRDIALRVNEDSPKLLEWHRHDYWIVKLDKPIILYKRWGNYALQKHYLGYRAHRGEIVRFILVDRRSSAKFDLPNTRWADVDQHDRLILAKEGKLFLADVSGDELALTELADFNANRPEQVRTPDWARRW